MSESPMVTILMGSASDLPVMEGASSVLDDLQIPWEMAVRSAHRTPVETMATVRAAEEKGVKVIICGAGMAAHLAGVVAAESLLPVIGVPVGASFDGMDALLATVQMPPGVPVATVAVGKAGAKNAAWLAARILALGDSAVSTRLIAAKEAQRAKVISDDAKLQAKIKR
jgi:5-(carboxyamino)imidazole ribonucleotide mutase